MLDRFFDNYVMTPQSKFVFDALRPPQSRDPFGNG
jgi:glutathione S-transferase